MRDPLIERIIASRAKCDTVEPGQICTVRIDRVYMQDGNSPTIADIFAREGFNSVFDPERIAAFFDHSVLPPNISIADRLRAAEAFCHQFGLTVFEMGSGISHVLAEEIGWFEPGTIVLGSDSHTCTGGAWQCLALGMGATDIAAAMVTGRAWLRIPETVRVMVSGSPSPYTRAKDIALFVAATQRPERFLYRAIEWIGPWISSLSSNGAATLANMAVEQGAKCAFLPPGPGREHLDPLDTNPGRYFETVEIDIDELPPYISRPHSPNNGVPLDACRGQAINHVFVGSCTNSRIEDLEEVARVLAEEKVRHGVFLVVTPGSRSVYLRALQEGHIATIIQAGGVVTPPGCGACLGTQGPVPSTGDKVLATMNRNFIGRMGNPGADVYLASPLVAAHTAVRGEIPGVEDLW
jgi:3-isopropylmalate/(R)-2-methylmalate dehydratase large subunit